ncbi:MAG: alpha/beta hydrolase [Candidatus Komeilibacteria bacterium]|nr:alpha/beta hydrolase [Candidatus Komeilibacteria bacterium]
MRIILMHGKDTGPSEKWYPWLGDAIRQTGHEYFAPQLPKANDPHLEEWLAELDKLEPDDDTVLIGHSRGGVAILRWLERQAAEVRVKKVILLATNSGRLADKAIPSESNYGFYTEEGYNFKKIRKHCTDFVVMHSRDDSWVPFVAGQMNAKGLEARFITFDNYGHFGTGVHSVPELLREIE